MFSKGYSNVPKRFGNRNHYNKSCTVCIHINPLGKCSLKKVLREDMVVTDELEFCCFFKARTKTK